MNNNLHQLLSFVGLTDDQITHLTTNFSGLSSRNINSIAKCIATVTSFGFPKTELPELIMINPNFLLNDPNVISKTLAQITEDIESYLLKNPYII